VVVRKFCHFTTTTTVTHGCKVAEVELKTGLELMSKNKKTIQDLIALVDPPTTNQRKIQSPNSPPPFFEINTFSQIFSRKKKSRSHYSKGEINQLIDSLLHPLFDNNPTLMIVDTVLHGLVEQNSQETFLKFIRYSLPNIIKDKAYVHEHATGHLKDAKKAKKKY
jgi:hypothetical protein